MTYMIRTIVAESGEEVDPTEGLEGTWEVVQWDHAGVVYGEDSEGKETSANEYSVILRKADVYCGAWKGRVEDE